MNEKDLIPKIYDNSSEFVIKIPPSISFNLLFSLIDKAKNRVIPDGVYCERHHIKPSSLGGNNDKDNIVRLYPREHYIAHLLLFKKYEKLYQSDKSYRNEYIKTLWAMSALYYLPSVKTEDCLRKRVFKGNSHIYSEVKEKLSVLNRIRLKERLKSLSEEEKSELYEKISKGDLLKLFEKYFNYPFSACEENQEFAKLEAFNSIYLSVYKNALKQKKL